MAAASAAGICLSSRRPWRPFTTRHRPRPAPQSVRLTTRRTVAAVAGVCLLAIAGGLLVFEGKQPGDITKKLGALVLIVQGHPETGTDIAPREAAAGGLRANRAPPPAKR